MDSYLIVNCNNLQLFKKPFVRMAFCDAQSLHGFGPCETKVNNIYLQIIINNQCICNTTNFVCESVVIFLLLWYI